jgi:YggT family protein
MQNLLFNLINLLYYAIVILIFARIVLSFINISPYHPASRLVYDLTEPVLGPVRRYIPPMSGFDFSPLIVLLVAGFLRRLLLSVVIAL